MENMFVKSLKKFVKLKNVYVKTLLVSYNQQLFYLVSSEFHTFITTGTCEGKQADGLPLNLI